MTVLKLSENGQRRRKKLKEGLVGSSTSPLFIRATGEKVFRWVDLTPVERKILRKKRLMNRYNNNDKELRKEANIEAELLIASQALDESLFSNDLHSAKHWVTRIESLLQKVSDKDRIGPSVMKKIDAFNRLDTLNLLKENNTKAYRDRRIGKTPQQGMNTSDFARDHGQFGSMPSFEGDESSES